MNTFIAETAELEDSPNNYYGTKTPSGNPRIYNCDQCKRAFTREEHLTRHTLSTHNKLKPFTCGICSRPFSRRDLLLRHAKNLHQGSELAVSRIRKSYKRGEFGSENDTTTVVTLEDKTSDMSASSSPIESEIYEPFERLVSQSASTNYASAVGAVSGVTAKALATVDCETPEKKRMKMSVNMLVS